MSFSAEKKPLAIVLDFEGIDGAGKATQVAMMAEYLRSKGKKVAVFSFPRYKTTVAGRLLNIVIQSDDAESYKFATLDPYASAFIHFADYAESFAEIMQAMKECDYVLFDRYVNSTLFHHGGKLQGEERQKFVGYFYQVAHHDRGYPVPDHVFYLDAPLELSLERTRSRAKLQNREPDAVEANIKYISDSHEAGLDLAQKYGWNVIPLTKDSEALPREKVFELVTRKLKLVA
ncbi:MAG: hypothetical protein KBC21_01680 [Candidatus Pacebacteria bacterium]|nr:hypothetical protein [Candidatus Paceibacterota bacterium]